MKKKNVILVVVGLLAIILLIVMLITTEEVYSTICTHCDGDGEIETICNDGYTRDCYICNGFGYAICPGGSSDVCTSCNGTGKCSGVPELNQEFAYTCPECGNKNAIGRLWMCPKCHILGGSYGCNACGAKMSTDFHKNSLCIDCNATGIINEQPCEHGKLEEHLIICEYCNGNGEFNYPCSHGYTQPHVITKTCTVCNGIGHIHSGATHANGGVCEDCGEVYETHSQDSTIERYTTTSTGHTPLYRCTYPGCEGTYPGTEEPHSGGTHANGGKCTICEYVYQNHSQSTTIDRYIISPTGHTPVYKCTEPGCTETYIGEEEPHTYEDGVCTECGEKEPTEECTHENKEWHSNETEHWEECVDCGEEIPGTREPHTYQDGTCTECGEKEPTEECTHEHRKWQASDKEHWQECIDCGEEIPGTREAHTYEDGECIECGEKESTEECTHEHRKWQASDKEHWQECIDCGEEIPGTREAHTYEDGECTKCGIKDTTTGNKDIPFTGEKHIIWVPITILAILTIYGAVELKIYKNIK